MIYKLFYILMLVGYLGLSLQTPDIKGKLIGIVLLIANALIFWR
jgi:hypothetical protein